MLQAADAKIKFENRDRRRLITSTTKARLLMLSRFYVFVTTFTHRNFGSQWLWGFHYPFHRFLMKQEKCVLKEGFVAVQSQKTNLVGSQYHRNTLHAMGSSVSPLFLQFCHRAPLSRQ